LAADRPRDINLDCGVGAIATEAKFFEPEVGELSSFDSRVQETAQSTGTLGSTRTVAVMPLTDLLKLHCMDRTIDLLKIDVEGWEGEVLKGLDLRLYRPMIVLIEATTNTRHPRSLACVCARETLATPQIPPEVASRLRGTENE
jgi:FkbM family methyltransferase